MSDDGGNGGGGMVSELVFALVGVALACAGIGLGLVIAFATGVGVKTVTDETVVFTSAKTAAVAAPCHVRANGLLPDPVCTPGLVDQHVRQSNIRRTICRRGYATSVRPSRTVSGRLKRRVMSAYGVVGSHSYQLDHLIPLELGGNPLSTKNLWPEAYRTARGARTKDQVENRLHRDVCAGRRTLAQARTLIRTDWQKALSGG